MKINTVWSFIVHSLLQNPLFYLFILLILLILLYIEQKLSKKKILEAFEVKTNDIKKEIESSVQSKFIQISPEAEVLIQTALDWWRLNKKIVEFSKHLGDKEKQSLAFSSERMRMDISKFDIDLIDYTNKKYYEGLNVEVISVEKKKKSSGTLLVKETLEPAVTIKGQLIKKAKVILKAE